PDVWVRLAGVFGGVLLCSGLRLPPLRSRQRLRAGPREDPRHQCPHILWAWPPPARVGWQPPKFPEVELSLSGIVRVPAAYGEPREWEEFDTPKRKFRLRILARA